MGWFSEVLTKGEIEAFSQEVRKELGAKVPEGRVASAYELFFVGGELRDVLDSISIIGKILDTRTPFPIPAPARDEWTKFVTRVFQEEGLGYVLNSDGGVRFKVDHEYERNRFSVIDGLANRRYAAVKHAVERAFAHLDAGRDTTAAVGEMFEVAEILAKLMAATNEDLDERMVKTRIKPIANRVHSDNPSATSFADQMLEGFAKCVNAGHKYRHGQKTEEPIAPPIDMAVAYVSGGASHIRFLVSIDVIMQLVG